MGWGQVLSPRAPLQHVAPGEEGNKRFGYMWFYPPSTRLADAASRPGAAALVRQQAYALALYLFNMYVSSQSYAQRGDGPLSLNYLGVFDGFMMGDSPFDFKKATAFYNQYYQQVHDYIDSFMQGHSYPWPQPSKQMYENWVALLENQPIRQQQITYVFPRVNLFYKPAMQEEYERLGKLAQQAQERMQNKVVVFDEPDLQLSDLDSRIGNYRVRRKRTYRWVKEECNYSSYLIAQTVNTAAVSKRQEGPSIRVYMLSALPKTVEFLTPARGTRFMLADGTTGLHWRYHTAVLVVLARGGLYELVVLDSLLGGSQPLPLQQWIKQFSSNTLFTAKPFRRSQTVENALHTPQRIDVNTVWVDKLPYLPADVVQ